MNEKIKFISAFLEAKRESTFKEVLTRLFIEFGLPLGIRSDNGSPFASTSLAGGLSKLAVWLITLGIAPERTS